MLAWLWQRMWVLFCLRLPWRPPPDPPLYNFAVLPVDNSGRKNKNREGGRWWWSLKTRFVPHGLMLLDAFYNLLVYICSINVYHVKFKMFAESLQRAKMSIHQVDLNNAMSFFFFLFSVSEKVESSERGQTQRSHPGKWNALFRLWAHEGEPLPARERALRTRVSFF